MSSEAVKQQVDRLLFVSLTYGNSALPDKVFCDQVH